MDKKTEDILRAALYVPCETMEQLHRWIKIYLGLDMPNVIICDDEIRHQSSNSSPMHLIWEMYSKAMVGDDPKFTQVLGYSAREGAKTLSAAIFEILCLFHLRCNVVHLASLESQSKFAQDYCAKFLKRPVLREYLTSKNKRNLEITRYESEDGAIISPVQWEQLLPGEKSKYEACVNNIQILVSTVESCNGIHSRSGCK